MVEVDYGQSLIRRNIHVCVETYPIQRHVPGYVESHIYMGLTMVWCVRHGYVRSLLLYCSLMQHTQDSLGHEGSLLNIPHRNQVLSSNQYKVRISRYQH